MDDAVMQPSEALYKKNVVILRGRFRPVTHVNVDMMLCGLRQYKKEPDVQKEQILILSELTLHDLQNEGEIDEADFMDRVDLLCSLGQKVMISNFQEHYKLASFLGQFTKKRKVGIILGINNLYRIFDEKFYENLNGGILESFGRLFGSNVKLMVYPSKSDNGEVNNCKNFKPAAHLKSLFLHLYENDKIADIEGAKLENLHIISDNVLKMIKNGESGWEKMMPNKVADAIVEHNMFGYKQPFQIDADVD